MVPKPDYPTVAGEDAGARIARIVRDYAGCSLSHDRDRLGALIARGVDDPAQVVGIRTNCATFALGVLAAAGCQHALLSQPYKVGWAFAWLVQIGTDCNAWRDPAVAPPRPGGVLWYRIAGANDDHAEFYLADADASNPEPEHGGGGRADDAITIGRGDTHESWSRPVHRWLDPEALGIPTAEQAAADVVPAAAT